jgi:hypothetical protein
VQIKNFAAKVVFQVPVIFLAGVKELFNSSSLEQPAVSRKIIK